MKTENEKCAQFIESIVAKVQGFSESTREFTHDELHCMLLKEGATTAQARVMADAVAETRSLGMMTPRTFARMLREYPADALIQ